MDALAQSLAAWLVRIEQGHTAEIALGLERVGTVAGRMGLCSPRARVITVGGTNGKGSCVAVIERLLLASGRRVGAYSSPHLRRYNERVRVQGREADDVSLCAAFAAVEAARGSVPLTYFEYGTLAALDVFRRAGCDWLVLEVGLGGRLDAVNLLDADVAVVTSVQIDHTDWLGADRESIGREKAGIFRCARPAVCGDRSPPASLRAVARTLDAPWYAIGEAFDCSRTAGGGWQWRGTDREGRALGRGALDPPQLLEDNVACALQALALAGALPEAGQLRELLPAIALPGRFQRLAFGAIECVLDVAHNPAGMERLAARLGAEPPRGRTVVLFAAMRDKDLAGMLQALAPVAHAWLFAELPHPRAAPAAEALAALGSCGTQAPADCRESVAAALDRAAATLDGGDRLVVCGSFQTVGPALDWFDERGMETGERK
jgi:dihydrofolate synthase / folylpolyglutamate synthase